MSDDDTATIDDASRGRFFPRNSVSSMLDAIITLLSGFSASSAL